MRRDVMDTFIASLQEDLRAQLNLVLNYADLVVEDLDPDEDELAGAVEDLSAAGQRAQAALEDVLERRQLDPAVSLAALRRALEVFVGHLPDLDAAAAASGRPGAQLDVLRIEAAARTALALARHRWIGRARPAGAPVMEGAAAAGPAGAGGPAGGVGGGAGGAAPDPGAATVLVVDPDPAGRDVLARRLGRFGHRVLTADGGRSALDVLRGEAVDLVLCELVMPGVNGYEVLEVLQDDERLREVPVIVLSSRTGLATAVDCIEAGAEDFLPKPYDPVLLEARVNASLERKRLRDQERALLDTVSRQATALAELNDMLESRVNQQVAEIGRLAQLRRFLSPQIADVILSSGPDRVLETHRSEIAVLFCDLRGFTAFAEGSEPEEVMDVLRDYHSIVGALINEFEATVGFFAGDGLMVFFNDPVPVADPALRAVRLAVAMRDAMGAPIGRWRRRGHSLGFAVGVAHGYATLGRIGFENRNDYGAIGSVVNLAARLCDQARHGEILISGRVQAAVDPDIPVDEPRELTLKGFHAPVRAFNVK